ncbi:MAG: hypothetical protein Q8L48_21215 [Archangium sp.]|nr:hypothetical protein [Archangium sp.]
MKRVLLAVAVVALAVAGMLVSRYRANRMVSPYEYEVRPLAEAAAEGLRLGLEPVQVGTLRGLMRRPSSGHAWLIYWGGNTSSYFKHAVDTLVGFALPADIGVLLVAPPGFDSEGVPSPEGLERDAVMVREWLEQHEAAEKIVTAGYSMGIYPALVAAERGVVATVVMGSATLFEAGYPGWMMHFREPDRYRIRATPPKVPALAIQGELDELAMGREVAQWLGARLIVLPGLGHVETRTDPTALREASAFIQQNLSLR